ncbi:histone deacetylase 6-like [Heterodontus francisci]|uniref:histone deacetylase 6-like n=1 Tax=Heterodontus francisci TaxID=7792 RepID=UPI00355C9909
MEQDQLFSRARLGSLAARTAQPNTSTMSAKKGKQNSSQADQKKRVRLHDTVGEDEIISQLTHLDLDKDRLVAGTALIYDTEMTEPKCLWDSKSPESPERVIAVMEAIEKYGLLERCKLIPVREYKSNS